jgi:hypothetical protein
MRFYCPKCLYKENCEEIDCIYFELYKKTYGVHCGKRNIEKKRTLYAMREE